MPFVLRKINPEYIGRGHIPQDRTCVETWPIGAELDVIINGALVSILKQLASVLDAAEDIFEGLNSELGDVANRSGNLHQRIHQLDCRLSSIDPKKIPVPESDICSFAARTEHFKAVQTPTTNLFVINTRPRALKKMYEATTVISVRKWDKFKKETVNKEDMEMFLYSSLSEAKKRLNQTLDIESRVPAIINNLRKWTSTEVLGDITVSPDCLPRILQKSNSSNDIIDHKLPSPEERVQAIALKFPAEVIAVDVSGIRFARMSMRKKLLICQAHQQQQQQLNGGNGVVIVKRRPSRTRASRSKRRNTIAGTNGKDIQQQKKKELIVDESLANGSTITDYHITRVEDETQDILLSANSSNKKEYRRSISTDVLEHRKDTSMELTKWNFEAFKAWGKLQLKRITPKLELDNHVNDKTAIKSITNDNNSSIEEVMATPTSKFHSKHRSAHERKPSLSSLSARSTTSNNTLSTQNSNTLENTQCHDIIRLRENADPRRERRKGHKISSRDEPMHSSSGNWSASSDSDRTSSIGSNETTAAANYSRPASTVPTTTILMNRDGSPIKLSHTYITRFRDKDMSTSSSVTSEGTLTPDIIHDISTTSFSDEIEVEGETSSVYSCDTEGYYTSFHMDSGLKTLREEEVTAPVSQNNSTVENDYELFGRGSTSTTTSSAGTVCTALMAPMPPERKSSLTVVAMVHGHNDGRNSPDNRQNTYSSTDESTSHSAVITSNASDIFSSARSYSELEYSESSDLEGSDRIERIRSKTAINTNRIPSMCIITPSGSDDEQHQNNSPHDITAATLSAVLSAVGEANNNRNSNNNDTSNNSHKNETEKINNEQNKNIYAKVQKAVEANTAGSVLKDIQSAKSSQINGIISADSETSVLKNYQNIDNSGDYVTIVRKNNGKANQSDYSHLNRSLYANLNPLKKNQEHQDSEYVSLAELPKKCDNSPEKKQQKQRQGARVILDYEGRVIYSSNSLKRNKGHTTFNPGPFIKDTLSSPPAVQSRKIRTITTDKDKQQKEMSVKSSSLSLSSRASSSSSSSSSTVSVKERNIENYCSDNSSDGDKNKSDVTKSESNSNNNISSDKMGASTQSNKNVMNNNNKQLLSLKIDEEKKSRRAYVNIQSENNNEDNRLLGNDEHDHGGNNHFIYSEHTPKTHQNKSTIEQKSRNSAPELFKNSQTDTKEYTNGHNSNSDHLEQSKKQRLNNSYSTTDSLPNRTITSNANESISTDRSSHLPMNSLILSPSPLIPQIAKCTMSNDELFAAIYKSKRKLNIKNDDVISERQRPTSNLNMNFYNNNHHNNNNHDNEAIENDNKISAQRNWRYEHENLSRPKIASPKRTSSNLTSTSACLDFKRLLLQQSTKVRPNNLSASEQLKLSSSLSRNHRHQQQPQPYALSSHSNNRVYRSPRSFWKFQIPRSDILSSIIIEDTAAEEKAINNYMNISTENISVPMQNNNNNNNNNNNIDNISNKKTDKTNGSLAANSRYLHCINNNTPKSYSTSDISPTDKENAGLDLKNVTNYRQIQNYRLNNKYSDSTISSSSYANNNQLLHRYEFRARSASPSQLPLLPSSTPKDNKKVVSRSISAPTLETAL
ncbi:putative uncharacterized protein DDB_G0277255 [Chelonus insularis]|uniref:putative uncharacterized protein DDB_G0277255 n=1 Tax=Chelonus insularis TaxID=460826 RepID=UPI00158B32ED|nr:putative uncharacterized protein DDB_G0277255 [Chelonus insularis]